MAGPQPAWRALQQRNYAVEEEDDAEFDSPDDQDEPESEPFPPHPQQGWQIRPSTRQVPVNQFTHTRDLPLPATLDAAIDGVSCKAQYLGHGQSKVAYLLHGDQFSGKVLKLCKEPDQEPWLFAELSSTGLYPQVLGAVLDCHEYNSVGQLVGQWNAWVSEYATPLDQYLKQPHLPAGAIKTSVVGAVRCMLHGARHGHIMSDNSLFNFGRLPSDSEIKIIDAGSRQLSLDPWAKSDFNKTCMQKFWAKLQLYVPIPEFASFREAWQKAHDMDTARNAFDELWNECRRAEQPAVPLRGCISEHFNVERPAFTPNVATLSEWISTETLDWLVQNFLWGEISVYSLACDGTLAFNPDRGRVSADVKLELLIQLTRGRRAQFCANPDVDILPEENLAIVLKAWKDDYRQWMHPEKLRLSSSLSPQKWHQTLRTSFRSHLFHLVGCYEMSLFFVVAPFTPANLDLFKHAWRNSATNAEAFELSKRLARESRPVLHGLPYRSAASTRS